MSTSEQIKQLDKLIRIARASEQGFNIASANVKNRGLKLMLKTYAQQRAEFAEQLEADVKRLGGDSAERPSIPGMVHRGWINIRAALTVGPHDTERVTLGECLRGEDEAMKRYQTALASGLDATSSELVTEQLEAISAVHERVAALSGKSGEQLVMRLYDSEDNAKGVVSALVDKGHAPESIQTVSLSELFRPYTPRNAAHTIGESALTGALIGLLAGFATAIVSTLFIDNQYALVFSLGMLLGAFFGAILGAIVGAGVKEEDEHIYERSMSEGKLLVMLPTAPESARDVSLLMRKYRTA